MIRAVPLERLRMLARSSGVRLRIVIDGDDTGSVKRDLVRALLRVPGVACEHDSETYSLIFRAPRLRYRLAILSDATLEAVRPKRSIDRAEPFYTPAERAEIEGASTYDGAQDKIRERIRRETRAAAEIVDRSRRWAEVWNEEKSEWIRAFTK